MSLNTTDDGPEPRKPRHTQQLPSLFQGLGIVRVYTKAPSKPPDMGQPFTVRQGDTVLDVARLVANDDVLVEECDTSNNAVLLDLGCE